MFLNDTLKMFQNCVVLALIGCASWDVRLGAAEALTPSQPLAGATVAAATVTLPASCDIERLTELVSQATGVPLQWGAGKIRAFPAGPPCLPVRMVNKPRLASGAGFVGAGHRI